MKENRQSFLDRLSQRIATTTYVNVDNDSVFRAEHGYITSKYAHRHNFRKQIDPDTKKPQRYFEHCRRAALILMDEVECYDATLINVALHHDTIEDTTAIDYPKMKAWLGREVADRVLLLTKTDENKETYLNTLHDEADWGTITVKLCDRYDNLCTMQDCTHDFVLKQIAETRDHIYPLMERLNEIAPRSMLYGITKLINKVQRKILQLQHY